MIDSPVCPPAAEGPVKVLDSCHRRIALECAKLAELAREIGTSRAPADLLPRAQASLRYFNNVGRNHHLEDEEKGLFAMLRTSVSPALAQTLDALLPRLEAEHREIEAHWAKLSVELEALAAGAGRTLSESGVAEFAALYQRHIEAEEKTLMPTAYRVLSPEQWAALGEKMAARKG